MIQKTRLIYYISIYKILQIKEKKKTDQEIIEKKNKVKSLFFKKNS